ncbi:DUF7346 family protein [Natronolimnobius baerhuensis]|uniref:Uncharacterized protein n=1 Tax=Natronolimnobius baerhuensis TaxID=253108 RepID=A0A202EDH8_9EURY|nr:hypothetical protein [Natronolimnobius baerhuensis]OVE86050.1 hypothetical protein B2G88_04435 [Natronolimnobius baerhuensis]
MKTVQDDTGKRYLLLKQSTQASLVRDPDTGNECYIQNDRLESSDESTFETLAQTISPAVRTLLTNVHDETTLGILLELEARGPLSVRALLEADTCCESDLHGRLTVLSSADLIDETAVGGERGYRLTEECTTALEAIRTPADNHERDTDDETTSEAEATTISNTQPVQDS